MCVIHLLIAMIVTYSRTPIIRMSQQQKSTELHEIGTCELHVMYIRIQDLHKCNGNFIFFV